MRLVSLSFFVLSIIVLAACSSNHNNPVTTYNDAEIGQILMTVNESEIQMAQEVVDRGVNAEVKDYAEQMLEEHRKNNKQIKQLMVDADMDMDDDSVKSQSLWAKAKVEIKQLENLEGPALDKEYIEDQVETHKAVLKDLRSALIPQAKDQGLKAHLEETAKAIEDHLEEAQKLERQLI